MLCETRILLRLGVNAPSLFRLNSYQNTNNVFKVDEKAVAKRRGPKPQSIPMKIGNDPALWRFASLQEALEANTHLLARLIQAGAEQEQADERQVEPPEVVLVPESA
jgi:hypothetical protein